MKSFVKHLRYAIEALLVYKFYYLFLFLGIDRASFLGGKIARTIGPHLKVSNIARNNLAYVMPELSQQEREKIVIDMWDNLGRVAGELPHMKKLTGDKFWSRVSIEGKENLDNFRDKMRPGIFFSGHFANWEIIPKTGFESGIPMTLVYRHANNPWVDTLIQNSRSTISGKIYTKGREGAKQALKTLIEKGFVGMLVDQKMNDGIPSTFFGKPVMSASAMADLALKFKCSLQPIQVTRTNGAYFKVKIHPPLNLEGKTSAEITQEVNDLFEKWIRQEPAQWLWVHNRWPKQDIPST